MEKYPRMRMRKLRSFHTETVTQNQKKLSRSMLLTWIQIRYYFICIFFNLKGRRGPTGLKPPSQAGVVGKWFKGAAELKPAPDSLTLFLKNIVLLISERKGMGERNINDENHQSAASRDRARNLGTRPKGEPNRDLPVQRSTLNHWAMLAGPAILTLNALFDVCSSLLLPQNNQFLIQWEESTGSGGGRAEIDAHRSMSTAVPCLAHSLLGIILNFRDVGTYRGRLLCFSSYHNFPPDAKLWLLKPTAIAQCENSLSVRVRLGTAA